MYSVERHFFQLNSISFVEESWVLIYLTSINSCFYYYMSSFGSESIVLKDCAVDATEYALFLVQTAELHVLHCKESLQCFSSIQCTLWGINDILPHYSAPCRALHHDFLFTERYSIFFQFFSTRRTSSSLENLRLFLSWLHFKNAVFVPKNTKDP